MAIAIATDDGESTQISTKIRWLQQQYLLIRGDGSSA